MPGAESTRERDVRANGVAHRTATAYEECSRGRVCLLIKRGGVTVTEIRACTVYIHISRTQSASPECAPQIIRAVVISLADMTVDSVQGTTRNDGDKREQCQ